MERIELNNKKILVTGGAGFIGSNLIKRLLKETKGSTIVNIDNMNAYYDVSLKEYRLQELEKVASAVSPQTSYFFVKGDISDKATIDGLFEEYHFDVVVNLAAQAGVRYSIENPDVYIQSNMIGFYNILEACRHNPLEHLVYASSSSVYGGNKKCSHAARRCANYLCGCNSTGKGLWLYTKNNTPRRFEKVCHLVQGVLWL